VNEANEFEKPKSEPTPVDRLVIVFRVRRVPINTQFPGGRISVAMENRTTSIRSSSNM